MKAAGRCLGNRNDITGWNTCRLTKVNCEPAPSGFKLFAHIVQIVFNIFFTRKWSGRQNIPQTGGAIIAANHISNCDPVFLGEYLVFSGRWPRYLARHDLFTDNWFGRTLIKWGMIPVNRFAANPGQALIPAANALTEGKTIIIYPESTFTFDPDGWPMRGATGVARLALQTRKPVIPVGQWGAQEVMPGRKASFPKLFPRKTVQFAAGEPVQLDDLYEMADQHRAARIATERIMNQITSLVAEIRGEKAPDFHYDRRLRKRVAKPTEDEL